jgi:glutaredoxin-like YruB-family protein
MNKTVVLYSQPGCPPCNWVEQFLNARGVAYLKKDIQADEAALQELMRLKSHSTPTLVVGTRIMIGFDPDQLDQWLAELG